MRFASLLYAAGRGERLRPLTDVLPKPALPLLDVPLGAFALHRLAATVAPVVVNVSYLSHVVRQALEPFAAREALEFFEESPRPLGTAGTLRALGDRLGTRLVTRNADLLCDLDPSALLERHIATRAPATIAVHDASDGADFRVEGDRAVEFIDRRRERSSGARFLGMAVFENDALRVLREHGSADLARALLRPLAEAGDLAVHVHDGYAMDVGTLDRYIEASMDQLHARGVAASGDAPRATRPPGEIVEVDGGRAYVGPGADAAEDALADGAIVLASSRVESGAVVRRSVVWPRETVPAGVSLDGDVWMRGRAVRADKNAAG